MNHLVQIYALFHMWQWKLYYVSIIPDRHNSIPIFISDKPSVFVGTDFFSL